MNYVEPLLVFFTSAKFLTISYALVLLVAGFFLAKRISQWIETTLTHHFSRHHSMLMSRGVFYFTFLIFFVASLQHLGFNLSVLLGAAGVFTVAISFASQTAASNLISGIFLLFERPFQMGDNIEVKGINGIVESIDLLSTKLKTSDNKLVRIPNESLIKSEITNLSYYATRRLDLIVSVSYDTDLNEVKPMLLKITSHCKEVLNNPIPQVVLHKFADSAIQLKLMVWVNTSQLGSIKNTLQEMIKEEFDKNNIEMPFGQIIIHRP